MTNDKRTDNLDLPLQSKRRQLITFLLELLIKKRLQHRQLSFIHFTCLGDYSNIGVALKDSEFIYRQFSSILFCTRSNLSRKSGKINKIAEDHC